MDRHAPCPKIGHTWVDTGKSNAWDTRWRCSACGDLTYSETLPPGLEIPADSAQRPLGGLGAEPPESGGLPAEPEATISALVELLIPLLPVGAFGFMVRGILSTLLIELRHATPGELVKLAGVFHKLAPVRSTYLAVLVTEEDAEHARREETRELRAQLQRDKWNGSA